MKNVLLVLAFLLFIGAAVWNFVIADRLLVFYPDGWTWNSSVIGTIGFADEATGEFPTDVQFPDQDAINDTTRTVTVSYEGAPAGQALISDYFISRNVATGAIDWEFTYTATVDPETGHYVGDFAGDYYFLPPDIQKQTYSVRNSSYQGLPMTFQAEEELAGINTYRFVYSGDLPNTAAYAEYVELEPNQIITCFDFELIYWVEPTTSEILKYRERCPGDYVVDSTTGDRLNGLQRWSGETGGDDLIRRADEINGKLTNTRWYKTYLPALLLVGGIVALGAAFVIKPSQTAAAA